MPILWQSPLCDDAWLALQESRGVTVTLDRIDYSLIRVGPETCAVWNVRTGDVYTVPTSVILTVFDVPVDYRRPSDWPQAGDWAAVAGLVLLALALLLL